MPAVAPAPLVLVGGECVDPTQLSPDCQASGDVTVAINGVTIPSTADSYPFVLLEFQPFGRTVRAEAETPRAWADGAWSGAEWLEATTIPLTILVRAPNLDAAKGTRFWLPYHQQLAAAFAASHDDVALEFTIANPDRPTGGDTYVVYGRPRLLEAAGATALRGFMVERAAFRCLDPLVYSGGVDGVRSAELHLPTSTGGLGITSPDYLCAPFGITATVVAGRVTIQACGNTLTPLTLRIDGPATEPRVTLTVAGQPAQVLRYHGALAAGQWLDIDTRARTVLLNGTVSRRGLVSGDWFQLPPGSSEIAFDAADYTVDATLTVSWRDAWYA